MPTTESQNNNFANNKQDMVNSENIPARLKRESIATFESIKQFDENGNEYWTSRSLARILEYNDYRNFLKVIEKAKLACLNSNQQSQDHFVDINDMIPIGKGGNRPVTTIKLTRYACYLIVQNADPSKEIVAQGQNLDRVLREY